MSADPPGSDTEQFRRWITDVELSPEDTDPDCKFSARIFVDNELLSLRLCRSVKGKPRYFNFPPFTILEMDEAGESTLELPEAAWVVTVKSLTPATAEHLFPDELEKFKALEGAHEPNQTVLPDSTAKVSFLIYMKAWELLDQQTELDNMVQGILRSLTHIRDIVDIASQASSSTLNDATNLAKEPIQGILALLEDASVYIYSRYTTNDIARIPSEEIESNDSYDVEAFLARLRELQNAFFALWTSTMVSRSDPIYTIDGEHPGTPSQNNQTVADELTRGPDPYEALSLLRPMDPSGFDPDRACLNGTRDAILNKIITWSQNRENSETFMWISGQIGMGKTAVATSLCQRLCDIQALAGSFFCRREDPETRDPLRMINNLVHEIALQCPAYAQEVAAAIRANRKLCSAHLSLRYDGLIKKPLERLKLLSTPMTFVVVVDGLDQCGDVESRESILHKLYDMSQLVPWLKVIITGRPIADIQGFFQTNCPRAPILLLQDYDASDGIRAYIEGQLGQIGEKERWPLDSIDRLCTMAEGVYLWAAVATKYIKKSNLPALPRLKKVLENRKSAVTDRFDKLYIEALKTAFEDDDNEVAEDYLRCIGAILAILEREPLAVPDLQYLLLVAGRIDQVTLEQIVKNLEPLVCITDGQRLQFLHSSFKEFITNTSRSGQFAIRVDEYEAEPAACCLQIMEQDLRFNISDLETSHLLNSQVPDLKSRVESNIGPALKYACIHWIDHFSASPNQALIQLWKTFMEEPRFMYWIEALSLLGCLDRAVAGLSKLASLDLNRFNGCHLIVSWLKDAHRFLLSFYDTIAASTPHLYISALGFAPQGSLTAGRMRPFFPNTISAARDKDSRWHPCVTSITHPHAVQSFSLSPDGASIVTGYPDGSLSIWNTHTSALVYKSPIQHRDSVTCLTFSLDGKLVASGSYDTTVRLWDTAGSLRYCGTLTGHSGSINAVAFSPDATLLASGSSDKTIRLWDVRSSKPMHGLYMGHSNRVSCLAFSPDGTKLVSGSWDKTIRVWSVDIGGLQLAANPLLITGHSESITCVAFSPDGSKLASGSMDKTIRMWDAQTGRPRGSSTSPTKHSDGVTSIAFSVDGSMIAPSSSNGAIQVRSTADFAELGQLFGHQNTVSGVAFSPDGAHIVSGSTDMTTRVWDISARPHLELMTTRPIVGRPHLILCIAVSSDGARIVSGSYDKTVRMWDTRTGTSIGNPFTSHSGPVRSVAISSNGTRVVSGSEDKTIKLWDTATGDVLNSYQHDSIIRSVMFSPNGAIITFGSDDSNVYLWEITGWKMRKCALKGHSGVVWSVTFSPDGTRIASASIDGTVRVWDIESHTRCGEPLSGHTNAVRSVAFSPCGTRLVSGSEDRTVRLWNIKTGNTIHALEGHSGYIITVAFTPDGLCIVTGSVDKTIRVWDTETGQLVQGPLTGHSDWVRSITSSPDGRYIISGSDDKTIRIWNLDTSSLANQANNSRTFFVGQQVHTGYLPILITRDG